MVFASAEMEKNEIVNNPSYPVELMRKRLKGIWKQEGKSKEEIDSIQTMKKKVVRMYLYQYLNMVVVAAKMESVSK